VLAGELGEYSNDGMVLMVISVWESAKVSSHETSQQNDNWNIEALPVTGKIKDGILAFYRFVEVEIVSILGGENDLVYLDLELNSEELRSRYTEKLSVK
jgi:hypothetical protein